jgi:hypothetical protein
MFLILAIMSVRLSLAVETVSVAVPAQILATQKTTHGQVRLSQPLGSQAN